MRKRLIEKLTNKKKGTLGYTLTEMLVVIGIIAIVCAIAIPSVIAISKALRFAQANNYAKSIFLAAQQNLSELRSDGSLAPLQGSNISAAPVARDHCGFPAEDWSDEYVYTASDMPVDEANNQLCAYDLVLPVNSVEATVRGEHVIIEYNPITGNVYSVFYCEDDGQQILKKYQEGLLPRDEDARRKMILGYYDGSGLSSTDLDLERSQAEVLFTNGEEGIITVRIPVPSHYYSKLDDFILGLEVKLTITGDNFGGAKEVIVKRSGQTLNPEDALDETRTFVLINYTLDSLADSGSFANVSVREETAAEGVILAEEETVYLSQLKNTDFMMGNLVKSILPGDNVTIQADVTFANEEGDPAVSIRPGILAGINPMFDYLLTSPVNPDKFTLAVANGRNLQNLNAIHPMVADCVESVVFTEDINWNTTVNYYNEEYGTSGVFRNNAAEAPGRALPYFVPIQNENLFGTADFIYSDGGSYSPGYRGRAEKILEWLVGSDFVRSNKVPTLTDEMDTRVVNGSQIGDTHAKIDGQGHKVYFLNIDATQYQPCGSTFYALGENQIVNYYFAGLFGYVNTTINNLHVANPIVKGHNFVNQDEAGNTVYMDPATGALVGAAGYNVLITNCSTYLDTTMEGFNWTYGLGTAQGNYDAEAEMKWYGVSGEGAVGGLVGYAKSHRTVVGELNSGDTRYLAFSNCFAAVPVSGDLRGTTNKDYGYSNGVGGFIGNSQLTNFYNCYSSGKVMARNTSYVSAGWRDDASTLLGLGGNGRLAQGAGGFVGTSHGTRYTNCFSTSNVINNSSNAATGGFVGMMCYDATKKYGHHADDLTKAEVDQHTVFDSCYATGICTNSTGAYLESFAGANGKIVVDYGTLRTFYTGDYYKLLAPYAITHYNATTKTYAYPPYNELYIFKDSYYLSQYKGTTGVSQQSASNKCAKPITYDELVNLHWKYNDETEGGWLDQQVEAARSYPLELKDIEPVVSQVLAEIFSLDFNDIIQGIFGGTNDNIERVKDILNTLREKQNYEVYFVLDKYRAQSLETDYFNFYNEGFPSLPWENATDITTHYYGEVDAGKVYPFPKLNTMDYYGLWPEKTLDAGLAYFEVYSADGAELGYYFDREDTSTLRNSKDVQVLSDGYCIFTANVDDVISVYINDSDTAVVSGLTPDRDELPVIMESAITPDRNSYYVVNLPWDALAVPAGDDYYYKIQFVIYNPTSNTTKTITAYFNPNVALSQVNSATRPNKLPTAISIRSARQLAALAGEPTMWGTGYNYIQWLNINVDAYTASSFAYNEVDKVLNEIEAGGSIGNAEHPFLGTYDGAGYAEVADIINFRPGTYAPETDLPATAGIFGVIGEGGQVKNLDIIYNKEAELALGSQDTDNAAILAGVNQGTISDVTLTLDQAVALTGKTNAGLLVGSLGDSNAENDVPGGILADCTLNINENASITAANAGLVIGASENAVISDVTAIQNSEAAVSATADYAGGFAGSMTNTDASDMTITLHAVTVQADAVGGFAGFTKGSGKNTVSAVVVNLKNTLSNTRTAGEDKAVYTAGFVGVSDTVKYSNITVNAEGNIEGSSAAGMFGTVNQGSIQNANANIKAAVQGSVDAAGFAVELMKGDYLVQQATVNLTTNNSKILSQGRAAGFAAEVGCTAMVTDVKLGAYMNKQPTATGTIQGAAEAAGYACSITGEVSDSHVRGSAVIRSTEGTAAGFAVEVANRVANSGVTPSMSDSTANYRGNSNANLVISGVNAAGFAANVANENAIVLNSYVLGTVSQLEASSAEETGGETEDGEEPEAPATAIAGFVLKNNGTVDGSTANVNIAGGYGFAGTNKSLIQNCYGWYSDGNESVYTAFTVAGDGKILSSYFADLDIFEGEAEEGAEVNSVVLYDYTGTAEQMLPSTLSGMLGKLNDPDSTTVEWYGPATYAARPYTNITPATYSYPMLRVHFGDWVTRPQYAYGVMYYEKHVVDGAVQWKYNIVDLTDPGETIEDNTLSISNDTFLNDGAEIAEAGYAVFCKSGVDPNGLFSGVKNWFDYENPIVDEAFQNQVAVEFVKNVRGTNASRYSFYKITALGDLTFDSADQEGEIRIVTWYANAIGTAGTAADPFLIRTPEQFGYVGKLFDAGFSQAHTIQVPESGFTTIVDFTGTYEGNGLPLLVNNSNAWITTLTGTVQNVNLAVSGDATAPIFGTVNGSLELDAVSLGSVSAEGALVGTVNNAAAAANENGGSVTTGTIKVGTVSGESFVPGAVAGKLFGTVNGTLNTGAVTVGAVSGSLVEAVGGPVTVGNISAGAVEGKLFGAIGADVTTGTISMASASGKVFEGVSAGNTTLGNITVTGSNVAELFGAITGGTVSGSTVSLPGNVTANLFNSVSGGATLKNFNVTVSGSLGTSLIGSVSGTAATENAQAVNTIVLNVDVTAKVEAASFTGSGLLVNTLGDYAEIENCDVKSGTVTVKGLAEYMQGETPTYPFGGITGVVPESATLKNNTVDADMNVFGEAEKLTVIGGMAAINAGEIDGGKVDANINYTQASKEIKDDSGNITGYTYDSAGIGGLVGWMLPGAKVSNFATAESDNTVTPGITGSITLLAEPVETEGSDDTAGEGETTAPEEIPEPVTAGRVYFIGGAIAYDDGYTSEDATTLTEYSNVVTAVVVSDDWAGGALVQADKPVNVVNPSGLGCVGKFVGYVRGGSFADCSATDTAANYQFLGEIQVNAATVNAEDPYSLYTSKSNQNNTNIDWTKDPTAEDLLEKGYTTVENNSYIWYDYPATLSGCTFGWTDTDGTEQTYTQTFDLTYLYGGTKVKRDLYKAVNVGMPSYEKESEDVMYAEFAYSTRRNATENNVDTGYFHKDESGQYYKVYVDYVKSDYIYHTYTLKYVDANGVTHKIHSEENITNPFVAYTKSDLHIQKLVSSFTVGGAGTMYMIVTRDDAYALDLDGQAIAFEKEFDLEAASSANIKKAIWTITGSGNNTRWQNVHDPSRYLQLERKNVYSNNSGTSINIRQIGYQKDIAEFQVGGKNWLTYNEKFGLSYTNDYSNASYKFFIYRVDRSGEIWGITFALRPEISEFCYAVRTDSEGNLITLGGTVSAATVDPVEQESLEETGTEATDAAAEMAATNPTEAESAATTATTESGSGEA